MVESIESYASKEICLKVARHKIPSGYNMTCTREGSEMWLHVTRTQVPGGVIATCTRMVERELLWREDYARKEGRAWGRAGVRWCGRWRREGSEGEAVRQCAVHPVVHDTNDTWLCQST